MLGNAAILQPTRHHTCNHGLVLTRLMAAIVPGAHGAHWLHSCRSAAVLTAVNQPGGLLHLLYNKVPGPRPLEILIELLPGRTVFGRQSLDTSAFAINKPFGQAVPGSECRAAAVRALYCT